VDLCARESPQLVERSGTDHPSACHFAEVREIVVTHDAGATG
jgi:oligopeptide transport system ATP-binding protein